jgi:hypothetical protein
MNGGESVKGEYDGEESYGKGILFGGAGSILRRNLILVDFGGIRSRGHQFAVGFGHEGQDILTVS